MPIRLSYILLILSLFVTACGGGGGGGSAPPPRSEPPELTFSIGGSMTGLTGSGLSIQINNGETLLITENGGFSFPTKLNNNSAYAVSIATQPLNPAQICTVNNGAGTVVGIDITDISIACVNAYSVAGTVAGLVGSGLSLQLNSGEIVPFLSNGNFSFNAAINVGASYEVTVYRYPTAPIQTCLVTNGSGVIPENDVTNVVVNCTTTTPYSFGGNVTGLQGSGFILASNTGEELPITASGSFTFPQQLGDGSRYIISVQSKPSAPSQTCNITNGTGTLTGADVTNISIDCVVDNFSVGGNVTGLVGEGLALRNYYNFYTDQLTVVNNGTFEFTPAYVDQLPYLVEVVTQPTNPKQTCTVINERGSLAGSNITNVDVSCVTDTFTLGGVTSGLMGSLVLQDNKGGGVTVDQSGVFTINESYIQGENYIVEVVSQPTNPAQTCTLSRGEGTFNIQNIVNVAITCNLNWQWANPKPQGNLLNDVAWSGTQYVAVGGMGTILSSSDGANWTLRQSGVERYPHAKNLTAITWSGSRFVAIGDSGARVTSTDGITWTDVSYSTSAGFESISWNGSQFLSFRRGYPTSYPTISEDGINWTTYFSNPVIGDQLRASTWDGSKYIAVGSSGSNGVIATSTDGINWTIVGDTYSNGLNDVVWTGTQFVAVGGSGFYMTSANGTDWVVATPFTTDAIVSVSWNGSEVVASTGTQAFTSSTGASDSWNALTIHTTSNVGVRKTIRSSNQYVAVGSRGSIFTSSTGSNWNDRYATISSENLNDIAWSGSQAVAVGNSGAIHTSSDGLNWQAQDSGVTVGLSGVVFAENIYVAVGGGGSVLTSSNGTDWTARVSNTTSNLNSVISTGTSFMAVGTLGAVITSPDGITWSASSTGETAELKDVVWDGSQYVAIGGSSSNGAVYTMPEGGAWQRQTTPAGAVGLTTIVWTGTQYVVVTTTFSTSGVMTSVNGADWVIPTPFVTSGPITNMIWDGLHLIGVQSSRVGSNANVYFHFSTDGINWHTQFTPSSTALRGVVSTDSQYIVIGYGGQIMRSLK